MQRVSVWWKNPHILGFFSSSVPKPNRITRLKFEAILPNILFRVRPVAGSWLAFICNVLTIKQSRYLKSLTKWCCMKILPVRILEPRLRRMCKLWLEGLMVGFQARISCSLNSPFLAQPFARFHAREKPTLRRQKFCQTMTWQSQTMLSDRSRYSRLLGLVTTSQYSGNVGKSKLHLAQLGAQG